MLTGRGRSRAWVRVQTQQNAAAIPATAKADVGGVRITRSDHRPIALGRAKF